MNKTISIIIPVLNEEDSLRELFFRIKKVIEKNNLKSELIFVDDGSTDKSFHIMEELNRNYPNVKVVQMRKNFGKSVALTAGFKESSNDIIVTIDADLQDDPNEIPEMLKKTEENYDLVSGFRKNRRDNFFKKLNSSIFNKSISFFTGVRVKDINTGLKAYRREVIDQINLYGGLYRFLPVLARQQGYKIIEMPVNHFKREHGKTKYSALKVFDGLIDLLTIILLTKYGEKPGHFFGGAGLISFFAGFLINLYLSILWLLGVGPIGNRPLFFLGILLLIIGIQLISLGLLGEMIIKNNKRENMPIKKIIHKSE